MQPEPEPELGEGRGAHLAGTDTNRLEIELRAVGPVHVAQRDDGGPFVDGVQQPCVPALSSPLGAIGRPHGAKLHRAAGGHLAPRVHVGRELLVGDHDVLPGGDRQVARGNGEAVGRRRDDGDTGRIWRVDQPPEQGARPVGFGEEVGLRQPRRHALARHTRHARGLHRSGQRRHVGAIQVVLVVWQRETRLLAGQHRCILAGREDACRRAPPPATSCCGNTPRSGPDPSWWASPDVRGSDGPLY